VPTHPTSPDPPARFFRLSYKRAQAGAQLAKSVAKQDERQRLAATVSGTDTFGEAQSMTITLSDNISPTSVNSNKSTFEFKTDANAKSDGRHFGQLMSHVFQVQTDSSADVDQKENLPAEKPWQEIADAFTMARQSGVVDPQASPLQVMTLKAVTLGPHMSVITPETSPPDSQSLQAFARAQGLDESAVNWLFGNHTGTLNAPWTGNPSDAPHAVTTGSAIGVPATMPNGQVSTAQLPLTIQTSVAAGQFTPTAHGQTTGSATHLLGQPMTAAQLTAAPHGQTTGSTTQLLGQAMTAAQLTAEPKGHTTGSATHLLGQPLTAAQLTAAVHVQTTGSATHLLGQVMTAAQVLWAMADEPAQTPKPTVPLNTEEVPALPMLRMPPPAAVWMQRNVSQSLLQHNERVPKETPASLSELDLGDDWGGETLQLLLGAEGKTLSTDSHGTTSANLAYRLDAQTHNRSDTANANGPAPELPDPKARSENIQNLAEKMGQAVGQRILSEMERGQWHLKLSLRPATLGHIEVEMKMRSGEFDAVFTAPNAVTRELLQEGLGKLKETLNQMGMNFASVNVGDGKSGQSGENSTPGSFRRQPEPTGTGTAETTLPITTRAPSIKDPATGLDVLV
jgi:flagellar hook-length control protein FliK